MMKLLTTMLRIAAIQIRTSDDRASTLERASELITSAAEEHGAKLVCLPEAFTGLYGVAHFESNAESWKSQDSGTQLMSSLAEKLGIYVCGGVIEKDDGDNKLYNTIAVFGPDGAEVTRYRKIHLSKVSVGGDSTSEGSLLEAGNELSYFDIKDKSFTWRVGLLNCFDLRFKEVSTMLTDEPPHGLGCDLLVYPSSWLKSTGDMGHWETLLRARALDGQCYVMGVSNAKDETQETVAFGRSCVNGPLGETVSVCKDDTMDEVVIADIDMDHLIDTRRRIPLKTSRRRQTYEAAFNHALDRASH